MRVVISFLVVAYLSTVNVAQDPLPKGGNHVVCYYAYWSIYRKTPYRFQPEDLDPFLCTHVIYAFATFGKNYDFDPTQEDFPEIQPRIVALKERNPKLKILIGAGGWREGTTGFAEITKTKDNRVKFAQNVVSFVRENNFDGIDLNWQHPTFREGGTPEDRENYVFLAQTLREEFEKEAIKTGNPRMLLSISIAISQKVLPAYDIMSFNNYMDFISVLGYDYDFSYTNTVKHHSPLYAIPDSPDYESDKTVNIDSSINYFLKQAVPSKLLLGIPTYGRTKTLADPAETEIGAEADGPGMPGNFTEESGILGYFEICLNIKYENWTVAQTKPFGNVGPHAFKGNQWVGYDDEEMVRTKARYARQRGLAGVVFWTIDTDDFLAACGNRRYPLINAAKIELNSGRNETPTEYPEEPIRTTAKPSTMRPPTTPARQPPTTTNREPTITTPTPIPPTPPQPKNMRTRTPVVMTPPPSLADAYNQPQPIDHREDGPVNGQMDDNYYLQDDLVKELVQLIGKAGGMKSFCKLLREAKTKYKITKGSGGYPIRRYDDMIVDAPNVEPFRLLISNSSITIQELNIFGRP